MVFARLTPADKDAFFALLDEYFESRPELFKNGNGSNASAINGVAAGKAAVASAFSAAAAANASTSPPPVNGWKRPDATANADIGNSVGRVAAAAAALKQNGGDQVPGFLRPPARRNPSSSSEEPAPEHAKLVQTRKFGGDVDVSSAKNMFSSIRGSTAAKHATPAQVAPPTPPAFPRRNDFAPPPRRVPSTSGSSNASPAANTPPPPIPRRAQQEPEPEEEGEWAEALYDYHSEDPGDLDLQEGVRVLITEKTSDDWWTGEIDGQRGLVPAAYVKLL
ncbi:SH3-domain-containing protein [Cubamyces sp. BRFM 1775]|nr:SH3-domain-containing protein [Cubamyces sp. BRFM 1775]